MTELFTDLASSTLASGIASAAVSLTVQSGDGSLYPAPTGGDFFKVFLYKKSTGESEFVSCTARSGDVFTISATSRAYNAGDVVELRPTASFFNALAAGASSVNIQSGEFVYGGTDTGAADAYVFAMTPTVVTLVAGMKIRCKVGANNTGGACTLKLDGTAAGTITMEDGSTPPAGAIKSGYTHTFTWDGTNYILQSTGLALTTTGFNALAKQIKNVAAGTAATDAATIGGTESLKNKTFVDANNNEILKFASVASAVNEITVTNAATGNNPAIDASGEDVGIDVEGVTLKNGATTTDSVTAKTTNGDLVLSGNNTGRVIADGSPINSLETPVLHDDFFGYVSAGSPAVVGTQNWNHVADIIGTFGALDHPGIFYVQTIAVATNRAYLYLEANFFNDDIKSFDYIIKSPITITSLTIEIGMGSIGQPNLGSNSIYFQFDPAVSANWYFICRSSNTETVVDTGVAVSSNTWYHLRAEQNTSGVWTPVIDGTSYTNISTNVPSAQMDWNAQVTTNTTAARRLDVDYWGCEFDVLTR